MYIYDLIVDESRHGNTAHPVGKDCGRASALNDDAGGIFVLCLL